MFGSRDYAMRAWLGQIDCSRWASPGDVVLALQGRTCRSRPECSISRRFDKPSAFRFQMQTLGRLTSTEEFSNIVIKQTATAVVRMKDIATVDLRLGLFDQFLSRSRSGDRNRHLPAAGIECAVHRHEHQKDHG